MTSLADAISGDLAGWSGLSGDLEPLALEAELGVQWTPDPAPRSRAASAFTVLHGGRVDAWLRVGETEVTSLEFPAPESLDHAGVLADLGEPETVLRSNHFEVGAVVQEHVHAERGITVAVAEPFAEDRDEPWIVYVQLYRPMTAQAYVTSVGQSGDELRPYPRPPAA
jgi:hypothetical protein